MKTFDEFDFSLENEVYAVNIHDSASDEHVIIVDFCYADDDDPEVNQMILTSKELLEAVMLIFFGFCDAEVKDVLDEIKEI